MIMMIMMMKNDDDDNYADEDDDDDDDDNIYTNTFQKQWPPGNVLIDLNVVDR